MERRAVWAAITSILAFVLLASGCGGDTSSEETTGPATATGGLGPPTEQVLYGHLASLTRTGDRYELRFDPALFLSGETANVAAAEDGAVEPGQPVPNDNYVVEEGHRLFTYLVADDARVTVLTTGVAKMRITVPELARALQGKGDTTIWDPHTTGVWLTIDVETVREIVQQYRP